MDRKFLNIRSEGFDRRCTGMERRALDEACMQGKVICFYCCKLAISAGDARQL